MRHALLVVFLVCLPVTTFADEDLKKFERHLAAGVQAIDEGDFERGLYELERAREYHDHPLLRYHVARAHEKLGECAAAKVQYRVVLEDADAPVEVQKAAREALDAVDESCEPAASEATPEEEKPRPEKSVEEEPREPPDAASSPPQRDEPSPMWRIVGWTAVGAGAVVLGTLAVKKFVIETGRLREWDEYFDAAHGCEYESGDFVGADCDPSAARSDPEFDTFEEQRKKANRQNVAYLIAGAGLTAAGVTLLVITSGDHETSVSLAPLPSGLSVGLSMAWSCCATRASTQNDRERPDRR